MMFVHTLDGTHAAMTGFGTRLRTVAELRCAESHEVPCPPNGYGWPPSSEGNGTRLARFGRTSRSTSSPRSPVTQVSKRVRALLRHPVRTLGALETSSSSLSKRAVEVPRQYNGTDESRPPIAVPIFAPPSRGGHIGQYERTDGIARPISYVPDFSKSTRATQITRKGLTRPEQSRGLAPHRGTDFKIARNPQLRDPT